jgi:hypothetical protein
MTRERFAYCKSLNYDVLAVTELWRTQEKFQTKFKTFIVGEAKIDKETEEKRFPRDKAAGVGIILSEAARAKVLAFGSTGERSCYVRLQGPVCNLFFVATYLPHRGRVCPDQDDTIADLHEALKKAHPTDCIVLLGDLNEQLGPNIKNRTGRWAGGQSSKNAQKILDLMSMYDLYSVGTLFEQPKGESSHTYICPQAKEDGEHAQGGHAQGDFGLHVGHKVSHTYNGATIQGEVTAVEQGDGEKKDKWTIQFEDGYTLRCGKHRLRKLLSRANGGQAQEKKQIDHILVSNRWRSSVTNCSPRWEPSVHRSLSGKRSDHALVECSWKWRLRLTKTVPVPDFSVLKAAGIKTRQAR